MKNAANAVLAAGLVLFGVSMMLPANSDWLGLFLGLYAVEVVAHGPAGVPDYWLYAVITLGNLLAVITPPVFAWMPKWGARLVAPALVLVAAGAGYAHIRYPARTWAIGFQIWGAAFLVLTAALLLRVRTHAEPAPAEDLGQGDLDRALETLRDRRKTG